MEVLFSTVSNEISFGLDDENSEDDDDPTTMLTALVKGQCHISARDNL
jgi:hypothetical protein